MKRYRYLPTYRYYDVEGCPLTLEKGIGKDIRNYKIYGNSVQDGTPTPDAPIEIESVGNKTKNLLPYPYYRSTNENDNGMTYRDNGNGGIKVEGSPTGYSQLVIMYGDIPSNLIGKKIFVKLLGEYNNIQFTFRLNEGNTTLYNGASSGTLNINLADYPTADRVTFSISRYANNVATNGIVYPVISVDEEMETYEPYGKYKIPVKVRGKNLINNIALTQTTNGVTVTHNKDGSITLNGTCTANFTVPIVGYTGYIAWDIPLSANTTYTLSGKGTLPSKVFMQSHGNVNGSAQYKTYSGNTPVTFTTAEAGKWSCYLNIQSGAVMDNVTIYPQMELGSKETEYEPYIEPVSTTIYLEEPLRKVGDYADYIDFKNQKVVKNIKEVELNGAEGWIYKTDFNSFSYGDESFKTRQIPICTHFKGISSGILSNDNSILINQEAIHLVKWDFNGDLEALKDFLETSNVKFINVLAISTEETIELPTLPTFKGTTIIEVDTTKPSNMIGQYYR